MSWIDPEELTLPKPGKHPKVTRTQTAVVAGGGLAGIAAAVVLVLAIGWFALGLFLDRPAPHPGWLIATLALLALAWRFIDIGPVQTVLHLFIGAIYLATLWLAVSTAKGDLVDARRRFRVIFIAAVAVLGLAVTGAELIMTEEEVGARVIIAAVASVYTAIGESRPEACIDDF